VMEVHGAGLISDQVALRELQFSARRTGHWKAITDEIVEAASDEVAPRGEDVVEPLPTPEDSQQSATANGAANQKAA
jgi:hypothetical protein